jgi:hypothetical protein
LVEGDDRLTVLTNSSIYTSVLERKGFNGTTSIITVLVTVASSIDDRSENVWFFALQAALAQQVDKAALRFFGIGNYRHQDLWWKVRDVSRLWHDVGLCC